MSRNYNEQNNINSNNNINATHKIYYGQSAFCTVYYYYYNTTTTLLLLECVRGKGNHYWYYYDSGLLRAQHSTSGVDDCWWVPCHALSRWGAVRCRFYWRTEVAFREHSLTVFQRQQNYIYIDQRNSLTGIGLPVPLFTLKSLVAHKMSGIAQLCTPETGGYTEGHHRYLLLPLGVCTCINKKFGLSSSL